MLRCAVLIYLAWLLPAMAQPLNPFFYPPDAAAIEAQKQKAVTVTANFGSGLECVSGGTRVDGRNLAFCFQGGEHFYTVVFEGSAMWIHAPNGATGCVLDLDSSKSKGNGTEASPNSWMRSSGTSRRVIPILYISSPKEPMFEMI